MNNFDKIVSRKGTNSIKYDKAPIENIPEKNYPLWIADMDFEVAPEIVDAMNKRLAHNLYGYFYLSDDYYNTIIDWHRDSFGVTGLAQEHICFQHGVLAGISHALDFLTKEGDPVLLQGPIYPGFSVVLNNLKRKIVPSLMTDNDGYFTMDFNDMEDKIVSENIKVLIFCSPHNPTGRVWEQDEMQKLVDLCVKHSVTILSDEIWSDLIINKELKHTPLVKAVPEAKDITISFYSPSKGFSLAGMFSAYSVCYNEELQSKLVASSDGHHSNNPTIFAVESNTAAYKHGKQWIDECKNYISDNMDYVCEFLETRLPKVTTRKPDATYLMWLDFTKTGVTHDEFIERTFAKAGFLGNDGHMFTVGGDMHLRINVATSRDFLKEALFSLEKEFSDIAK